MPGALPPPARPGRPAGRAAAPGGRPGPRDVQWSRAAPGATDQHPGLRNHGDRPGDQHAGPGRRTEDRGLRKVDRVRERVVQPLGYVYFFFNDPATTEIYTRKIVGSVRCV